MDYKLYEEVNDVVQREQSIGQDPEILGQLASIGIKKGQPFKPDPRMKKILSEAADLGAVTVRTLASQPRDHSFYMAAAMSLSTRTTPVILMSVPISTFMQQVSHP